MTNHPDLPIPNLHVWLMLRSLKSKNYVSKSFNWQHHYYVLTNEGVEILRGKLHLPTTAIPNTMMKNSSSRAMGKGHGRDDDQWRNESRRYGMGRGRIRQEA